MDKPVKHTIALALIRGSKVLVVLRPNDPGEELPGVWGLPAASQRGQESVDDMVRRIAHDKLGLPDVQIDQLLVHGSQERPSYILEMDIYMASTAASPRLPARPAVLHLQAAGRGVSTATVAPTTFYIDWQWAYPEVLTPAAKQGSLCAQLFLESQGRWRRKVS